MPSSDDLPDCSVCESSSGNEGLDCPEPDHIGLAELKEYGDLIESGSKFRHSARPQNLVAWYDLAEDWMCSYGHLHRHGLLVYGNCGALLSLGMQCAHKHLGDAALIEREVKTQKEIAQERALDREKPGEFLERTQTVLADINSLLRGVADLKQHLPDLHRAIFERHTRGPAGVQVPDRRYDPKAERWVEGFRQHVLTGLKLFGRFSESAQTALAVAAERYVAAARVRTVERSNHLAVRKQRLAVEDAIRAAEDWVNEAARFWLEDNLKAACYAAFGDRMLERVAVEGSSLLIQESGTSLTRHGVV